MRLLTNKFVYKKNATRRMQITATSTVHPVSRSELQMNVKTRKPECMQSEA